MVKCRHLGSTGDSSRVPWPLPTDFLFRTEGTFVTQSSSAHPEGPSLLSDACSFLRECSLRSDLGRVFSPLLLSLSDIKPFGFQVITCQQCCWTGDAIFQLLSSPTESFCPLLFKVLQSILPAFATSDKIPSTPACMYVLPWRYLFCLEDTPSRVSKMLFCPR